MTAPNGYESPAIAGSGTIACGLAACATVLGDVRILARSDTSAWKAQESAQSLATKVDGGSRDRIKVTTDPAQLAGCDLVVEAIVEDLESKAELLGTVGEASPEADLATTTSSLSVHAIAAACGHPDRLLGLHVFNPPHRMELVELCLPDGLRDGAADRARRWCEALGKSAIEVPDTAGFVVNRLIFPYLFDAVRLLERTGMEPADVDTCMRLGAGHPMGPLALLDFVGLDVAVAIGESLETESGEPAHGAPERIRALIGQGRLGRKSGGGFFDY
ncbi:MAG: 3-hydroxyacyl-CoA dehydrogenase family protein [Solirubrobacterales bacterium]